MMNVNAIIKLISIAAIATLLVSGCEDACEETELGFAFNAQFVLVADVTGPNGAELSGKSVDLEFIKNLMVKPQKVILDGQE